MRELGLESFLKRWSAMSRWTIRSLTRKVSKLRMRSLRMLEQRRPAYVGDSPEDIEMGKRAGILTVGVLSAYPTSWKLKSHEPDILIESLSEILLHF